MRDLLQEIPAIVISDGDRKKVIHGMDLNLLTADWESEEYRLIDESGELIALGRQDSDFYRLPWNNLLTGSGFIPI